MAIPQLEGWTRRPRSARPTGGAVGARRTRRARRALAALLGLAAACVCPSCARDEGGRDEAGPRLVIVGLDGADWNVVDRLRAAGRLPEISALVDTGARGELETFKRALSPVVWTSIATGMRPEHHGVADFYTSSDRVKVKRLWEIALDHGLSAGVQSYMVTWPPDERPDFVIPGWLAQDTRTHPPELAFVKRIDHWLSSDEPEHGPLALLSEAPAALRHGVSLRSAWRLLRAALLEAAGADPRTVDVSKRLASIAVEADVFCHLLRTRSPDLAIFYHHHIDAVGHLYFKYYEPDRFPGVSEADVRAHGDALPRIYEASDEAIGLIRSCAGEQARLVVVSDHGQRASFAEGGAPLRIRYRRLLEGLGLEGKLRGTHAGRSVQLRPITPDVDLERAAERLEGVVLLPGERPLYRVVPRRGGLLLRPGSYFDPEHEVRLGSTRVRMGELVRSGDRVSGQHTRTALLLVHGPGIAAGRVLPRGDVLDVAPTVLGLLGLPIGRDMPGRFLEEVLDPGALARLELDWVESHGASPGYRPWREPVRLSPTSIEELRDLGYVE